ncbi:MAG TPA: serine acetyltransferase, partial [Cyanophyceae cyanobacterium]
VGVPGRIVRSNGKLDNPLDHGYLPDAEAQAIRALLDRIKFLEQEIERLKIQSGCSLENSDELEIQEQQVFSNQLIEEFLDGAGI